MKTDHGRYSTYVNYGCRCVACREANRVYTRGAKKRRHARLLKDFSLAAHAKPSTYTNWGCRCDLCRGAYRDWQRAARGMA